MKSDETLNSADPAIARVLVPRDRIAQRVAELAGEITAFYKDKEITIVMVLTGALMLVADLVRHLDLPVRIEPVSVSSYPGQATRSQGPSFRLPPEKNLAGRDVLIVDDIYDSGLTMGFLTQAVTDAGATSVRSCVLLNKDRPDLETRPASPHFVGFDIPDAFVVGYGLDFDDLHRNLPDICVLAQHAEEGPDDA